VRGNAGVPPTVGHAIAAATLRRYDYELRLFWEIFMTISCRVLALMLIPLAGGCSHVNRTGLPNQSSPKDGLLAYYDALAAGDAAAVRGCLYVKPAHARFADDMAELWAVDAHFHHVINSHFPGQDKGLFWEWFTDDQLDEARRLLPEAALMRNGEHATIQGSPQGDRGTQRLGHQKSVLFNDGGRWKIDFEVTPDIDNYPPKVGTDAVGPGMMYLLHNACPNLLSIAADVESGKLKTIQEVKDAIEQRSLGNEEQAWKKLAEEPVNRGNPATQPKH
jgi:hypothetical protein